MIDEDDKSEPQVDEEEGGRRGRRAASQISFKEPSLRGKMRQVGSLSLIVQCDSMYIIH